MGEVEAIEVVERLDNGDGFGLGTTWRETRTMFGKKATEDMEVTEYEEGVRYRDGGRVARLEVLLRTSGRCRGAGGRIIDGLRGQPQTALTKAMDATVGRLLMGATREALAKDLEAIAAAAEARR